MRALRFRKGPVDLTLPAGPTFRTIAPPAAPGPAKPPFAEPQGPGTGPAQDRDLYWRIGTFLFDQALPPTPAYYLLGHIYVTREDPAIVAAIEAALAGGRRLLPHVADTILASAGLGGAGAASIRLERIAGETEARFDRVAGLVDQSFEDARTFGDALEANAADLSATDLIDTPVASALKDLAGAMISSTRHAESRLRRTAQEMDALRTELAAARADADTDALTELANRRAFDRRLAEARERAMIGGTLLTIALVDIDRFKDVNDSHGHDVGDRVLQLFARTLQDGCAPHAVARHGGEEFALLFVDMGARAAFALLDRTRVAMAQRSLRVAETRRTLGQLTFSGGLATFDGRESCEALLRRADILLYRAKQSGRNQLAM